MRNLKRALSLSMACIMLLGLLVVGASAAFADFTDVDKIENVEAVSTLVELGVIAGKEDGSYFDPNGIITRYEMCKLICVALSGGREPSLGIKDTPTYSDIKGSWAEAYVEYCSALGIVAGDGSGKFNGNLTVTGSEAAKMLLCALGYKADVEGYVGASWEINTNVRADQLDLYKGLEGLNPSLGLIRDDAAQMVFNALSCEEMYYTGAVVVGGVTIGNSQLVSRGYTWLEKRFGVEKVEGVIIANENASFTGDLLNKGNTSLLVGEYDFTDPTTWEIVTVKTSTSADLAGMKVTVYAKDLKNGVYQKVYGAPIVSESNTVVTITKEYTSDTTFASDLSKQGIKGLKGLAMINYLGDEWVVDYTPAAGMWATGNGVEITLINNDDSNSVADFVRVRLLSVGKVVAYNAKGNNGDGYISITDQGPGLLGDQSFGGLTFEEVVGYEDVAKDDIVLFYEVDDTWYVKLAETSTVTATKVSGGNMIAGSTTYKPSSISSSIDLATLIPGEDVELYFDEYGYVAYATGVTETAHYLYTTNDTAVRDPWAEAKAKAILEDGTSVTIEVYSINDTRLANGDAPATNTLYSYSVRSDGKYVLTNLGSGDPPAQLSMSAADIPVVYNNPTVGSYTANSKTIFLIKNVNGDWYSYTGIANVPKVDSTTYGAIYSKNGTTANFVVLEGAVTTGTTGKNIYILSGELIKGGTQATPKYYVAALVDGVFQELEVASAFATGDIDAGLYLDITLNSNGTVAKTALTGTPDAEADVVKVFSNDVIKSDSSIPYNYNANTKVLVISGDTEADVVAGEIGEVIFTDDAAKDSHIVIVPGTGANEFTAQWIFIVK